MMLPLRRLRPVRRPVVQLTVAALLLVAAVHAPTAGAGVDGGTTRQADVPIQMSDGVRLIGDVDLPAAAGRFPVVVNLTPYGPNTYQSDFLADGYAYLNVDIRGTGRSEGSFCVLCAREQRDAYEVIEWAARQPWSNGRIGMYGGSYQGQTPLLAAAQRPPHLRAIVPSVAISDVYRDIVWHNGLWNADFLAQWITAQTALSLSGTSTTSDLPARRGTVLVSETRQRPLDGPWYWERSLYTKHDRMSVPTLLIGGWFDGFSRATLRNFQGMAGTRNRLVMTPCTHKGCGLPFDPASPYDGSGFDQRAATKAWLDHHLRGVDNGADREPPVRWYDLGTSSWRTAATWPPPTVGQQRLRLAAPVGDSREGSLTATTPTGERARSLSVAYDPTIGATESFSKWGTVAATPHVRVDQRADEARALTWSTPVLTRPWTLAGPMELRFWASTTAPDMDWVVKVSDVAPDGSSSLLTSGYVRASHRAWDPRRSVDGEPWLPNTRLSAVPAGRPLQYRVDVWDIAATLQPGHRLRLSLASSDVPNHEPLAVTGTNTVFHDAAHPGELIIGVPPRPAGCPAAWTGRTCRR